MTHLTDAEKEQEKPVCCEKCRAVDTNVQMFPPKKWNTYSCTSPSCPCHKPQDKPMCCGRPFGLPLPATGWVNCNENQQCPTCRKLKETVKDDSHICNEDCWTVPGKCMIAKPQEKPCEHRSKSSLYYDGREIHRICNDCGKDFYTKPPVSVVEELKTITTGGIGYDSWVLAEKINELIRALNTLTKQR